MEKVFGKEKRDRRRLKEERKKHEQKRGRI